MLCGYATSLEDDLLLLRMDGAAADAPRPVVALRFRAGDEAVLRVARERRGAVLLRYNLYLY